jgi:hypothetical protein
MPEFLSQDETNIKSLAVEGPPPEKRRPYDPEVEIGATEWGAMDNDLGLNIINTNQSDFLRLASGVKLLSRQHPDRLKSERLSQGWQMASTYLGNKRIIELEKDGSTPAGWFLDQAWEAAIIYPERFNQLGVDDTYCEVYLKMLETSRTEGNMAQYVKNAAVLSILRPDLRPNIALDVDTANVAAAEIGVHLKDGTDMWDTAELCMGFKVFFPEHNMNNVITVDGWERMWETLGEYRRNGDWDVYVNMASLMEVLSHDEWEQVGYAIYPIKETARVEKETSRPMPERRDF